MTNQDLTRKDLMTKIALAHLSCGGMTREEATADFPRYRRMRVSELLAELVRINADYRKKVVEQ